MDLSIKKIAIIGPESTGKSTLSEALAKACNTAWVPEYARDYLLNIDRPYEEGDLLAIAEDQLKSEDNLLACADRFLFCDTDLNVIKVWSEAKYGYCHPWILEQIAQRHYDMYILTDIDIEWQDDPLREHPLPHERQYFYNIYMDIVQNSGVPWMVVSGSPDQRLNAALKGIERLA